VPGIDRTPDATVAARFLTQSLQNVDNRSWLAAASAFPAACIGTIDVTDPAEGITNIRRFWKAPANELEPSTTDAEFIEELYSTLSDAVRMRLHADVPVGIALSGGIDSSIIAALAYSRQSMAGRSTVLFSATNPGSPHDESAFIDVVARHLETEVDKFTLDASTGSSLFDLLMKCIRHNDGPIASFSNILFFRLMEMARKRGVTVVLTGQGADEAFCGYRKYPFLELKRLIREKGLLAASHLATGFLARGTMLPGLRIAEGKRYLGRTNHSILGPVAANAHHPIALGAIRTLSERQWQDIAHYSVPYLCHYEDRMSMAWSREVRAPFLDHRVVALGLRMPTRLKLANGWTKYALRKAFEPLLPPEIAWRKDKQGFVNPQDDWLRGSLRSHVVETMSRRDARVYDTGLVDREAYMKVFEAYCRGSSSIWFRDVFSPFALELWLHQLSGAPATLSAVS
jgi:asparagine synthase (glutamine-hydrolysing)